MTSAATSRATLIGLGAIALWGLLALLTTASGPIPPFQMAAMTFAVGGTLGLAVTVARGQLHALRQPPKVWALGIGGLFGFHALYFAALRLAPPAEANLINYLWPLFIVFFSALLLPGETVRPRHILGAALGFAGMLLLAFGGEKGISGFQWQYATGFAFAAASSVVWALYSVLSRRMSAVPTDAVTGFCLVTALLAFICHLLLEVTVWPVGAIQWVSILAAGLGPVGAAFFLWDIGMKQGDIRLLSVASYATPVLSTFALIIAGFASPGLALLGACGLIVAGAVVASR